MVEAADDKKNYTKEFLFTEQDFSYLSKLAGELAGISLSSGKRELIYGRLVKRLRALGLSDFKQYCTLLKEGDENKAREERTHFINAITTNVTSFFREDHHFEFMAETLLPELIAQKKTASRPSQSIWSAGCSSGKEPYSI
ncbi:MAG: chemotaxis protein CheR, partial [Gammaproteobacteria bacterium]|nr:chemotaxis protein CheR [Gammaproteobacteria bacterium]